MNLALAPIAKGIVTALIMTVGVGPGMMINFHTSLRRGFIAGLSVVFGLYLSDGIFIAINYFGVINLVQSFHHQRIGGIICGAVLCVIGGSMVLKKASGLVLQPNMGQPPPAASFVKGFLSGFMVNISNPFVFVFWITLMSIATLNFGFRTYPFHVYFSTVIGTALCLDITKSFLFSRIKTGLKAQVMTRINQGMGAVLSCAGIVIICRSMIAFS
jgi:threonine/homoserine/homoserine lactone efflux protein